MNLGDDLASQFDQTIWSPTGALRLLLRGELDRDCTEAAVYMLTASEEEWLAFAVDFLELNPSMTLDDDCQLRVCVFLSECRSVRRTLPHIRAIQNTLLESECTEYTLDACIGTRRAADNWNVVKYRIQLPKAAVPFLEPPTADLPLSNLSSMCVAAPKLKVGPFVFEVYDMLLLLVADLNIETKKTVLHVEPDVEPESRKVLDLRVMHAFVAMIRCSPCCVEAEVYVMKARRIHFEIDTE